jgi:hypothetical protein
MTDWKVRQEKTRQIIIQNHSQKTKRLPDEASMNVTLVIMN